MQGQSGKMKTNTDAKKVKEKLHLTRFVRVHRSESQMGHLTTKYKAYIDVGFNAFMQKFHIKSMILVENLLFDVSFFL